MMKIPAFLKGLPVTVYLVAGAVGVFAGALAINNAQQRAIGALDATMRDSQRASASTARILRERNKALDGKVAEFTARLATHATAKRATDAQTAQLRTARDSLAHVVADSLATIDALRDRAAQMIAASDAAEVARAKERAAAASALEQAQRTLIFAVDSVRTSAAEALAAAIHRAETAERAVKVRSTGLRARLLARCGLIGGYGGVLSGGAAHAGPAVTLGCRLVP